jgi:iron-sulfur cluster assembly protein
MLRDHLSPPPTIPLRLAIIARTDFSGASTDMAITLSPTAANEIRSIIDEQSKSGELKPDAVKLRVGVRGGGCSGFTYMLDLTEEEASDVDEQLESNGVKILIDQKSALYLDGTEIDFKDEVMGRGFVFKNPNATSSCGCGSSFQV